MKPPKKIVIELMAPDNKSILQRGTFAVPKGQRLTAAGIDKILGSYCSDVDLKYPGNWYRIVPLNGFKYRLVWEKQRPADITIDLSSGVNSGTTPVPFNP